MRWRTSESGHYSGSRSYGNIAGMTEVVGAFASTEPGHERADCATETANSPLRGLAQERFERAVSKLDGIEVGRVLRQVSNCRSRFLNRLPDPGHLVGFEVVHHDDVVALEGWNQA